MSSSVPSLSVVVPAYNEESRLLPSLEQIAQWLGQWGRSFEVLVVDDGSADRTAEIAHKFARGRDGFEVVSLERNRGKGAAVREGFARCRGEFVLFTDADLSTPLDELPPMTKVLENGVGFVIASRALPESKLEIRQAWYRERMGKTFNAFVRFVTGIPFADTQCGFKLLRGEDARALSEEMMEEGFAFDVELILLARRRGLEIREFPVTWRNDAGSRVNPVADSLRMLTALPRILGRIGRYVGS